MKCLMSGFRVVLTNSISFFEGAKLIILEVFVVKKYI